MLTSSTCLLADHALGYGSYLSRIVSPVEFVDPDVTWSPFFIWDDSGNAGNGWREIDIEFARWGNAGDPTSSQFVLKPLQVSGGAAAVLASCGARTRTANPSPPLCARRHAPLHAGRRPSSRLANTVHHSQPAHLPGQWRWRRGMQQPGAGQLQWHGGQQDDVPR